VSLVTSNEPRKSDFRCTNETGHYRLGGFVPTCDIKEAATGAALLHMPSFDLNKVDRLSGLVGHL
jgi:hypothetical protein